MTPTVAVIFVYALALPIEGALWAKLENHFHWNSTVPLDEPDDGTVEIAGVQRSVARSCGRHSRRSRGGDQTQASQVQEMGAAQDDLRAGSDFAIPEATSAGW
jgi:hypothetical protein